MIEKFNGIFLLIVFVVHFIGYVVYAYRCVFGTKSFLDQYAMHDSGAIMTRFFGAMFIGSFIMAMYIMFVRSGGVDGTWGFFNLIFLQNLSAFVVGVYTIKINKLKKKICQEELSTQTHTKKSRRCVRMSRPKKSQEDGSVVSAVQQWTRIRI